MASTTRSFRALSNVQAGPHCLPKCSISSVHNSFIATSATRILLPPAQVAYSRPSLSFASPAPFHTTTIASSKRAHNNEAVLDSAPTTDLSRLDVLGQTPAPSTSVDICSSDGFKLNSGVSIYHGNGALLVGGEAFEWRPWGPDYRLVNTKGQWEVSKEAWGLLELLWPRPGMCSSNH